MAALTTSEHGGFIRGFGSLPGSSDAADTAIVRDVLVNNLNHLTDVAGQELLNLQAVTSWQQGSPSTTVYRPLGALPQLPLPLRIRTDGASYFAVVYLRASISAAGTASFRIGLRPPSRGASSAVLPDPALGPTWTADTSTTSTTPVDLGPFALRFPAASVAAAFGSGAVTLSGAWPSDRGDGADETALVFPVTFEIWAKSSVLTSLPTVHAVEAREYIGKV